MLDDNRRAYVHHSAFGSGNLEVGERVECVVIPDKRNRGKFMVEKIKGRDKKTVVEDWTEGEVVEWNQDKRDGYVKLNDGRRLYVPSSVLFGGYLMMGSDIQVKPTEDRVLPGCWKAISVRGEGVMGGGNEPHVKRSAEPHVKRPRHH